MRERGLKLKACLTVHGCIWSLPVRERGLKRTRYLVKRQSEVVAPRAGAWIETLYISANLPIKSVAPRAGAWIETCLACSTTSQARVSLPVRERGLKPDYIYDLGT